MLYRKNLISDIILRKVKIKTMFTSRQLIRTYWLALIGLVCFSCAKPYYHYGAANDRTGTNGATTGTGKIATP